MLVLEMVVGIDDGPHRVNKPTGFKFLSFERNQERVPVERILCGVIHCGLSGGGEGQVIVLFTKYPNVAGRTW